MKLITESYKIISQNSNNLCGFIDYIKYINSFYNNTQEILDETNPKDFFKKTLKNNNGNILEHCTVYLYINYPWNALDSELCEHYLHNKNSEVVGPIYEKNDYKDGERQYSDAYITTNLKVIIENDWMDDLKYICEPTEYHEKRITIKIEDSMLFFNELFKRYDNKFSINIIDNKIEKDINYINPDFVKLKSGRYYRKDIGTICYNDEVINYNDYTPIEWEFINMLLDSEYSYFYLLDRKMDEKQAMYILPNSLKIDFIISGFVSDFKKLTALKTDKFNDLRAEIDKQ